MLESRKSLLLFFVGLVAIFLGAINIWGINNTYFYYGNLIFLSLMTLLQLKSFDKFDGIEKSIVAVINNSTQNKSEFDVQEFLNKGLVLEKSLLVKTINYYKNKGKIALDVKMSNLDSLPYQ